MHTVAAGDGVTGIKRRCRDLYSDGVRNFATASGRGRLKEDLESSTWRRRSFKDGDGDGDTHYERSHKGVKASANSDIIFFFTSAQDGNKLLDDERLSLADDLKKAHDQN
ncbi:hypothetical protein Tco_1312748 [Tanacetum coccineum]